MSATHLQEDLSAWLKSPLSEKGERLQPLREIVVEPFEGRKRKLQIFRSHYLIGTGRECDIRFEDPFLSPRHAEIVLREDGEGYELNDLGSRNGVFLNGVRVKSAPLPGKGVLRLGRSTLLWKQQEEEAVEGGQWIVADPYMKETLERLKSIAGSDLPVLLLGETGTGKEFLARFLHTYSTRVKGPYVTVNGALTGGPLAESELFGHRKGAFTGAAFARTGALRSAHQGTLFLDEVADIPLPAQVKLLRALEGGEVKPLGSDLAENSDFRLVSATSQDIEGKTSSGAFRLDLYYRIAGYLVHIPPLRERPLDILAIAGKMLEGAEFNLCSETEGKLLSYRWPGNVRELRAAVARAEVMARAEGSFRVLPRHFAGLEEGSILPPAEQPGRRAKTLEEAERDCIRYSLERNGWCRARTARELGIARSTLFQKMRRYAIRDKVEA